MIAPKFTRVEILLSPWWARAREEKENQQGGDERMAEMIQVAYLTCYLCFPSSLYCKRIYYKTSRSKFVTHTKQ